jgi:hypothetical protein
MPETYVIIHLPVQVHASTCICVWSFYSIVTPLLVPAPVLHTEHNTNTISMVHMVGLFTMKRMSTT